MAFRTLPSGQNHNQPDQNKRKSDPQGEPRNVEIEISAIALEAPSLHLPDRRQYPNEFGDNENVRQTLVFQTP